MRTLKQIRENNERIKLETQNEEINYKNPNNLTLITRIIKQQNMILLEHISKYKKLSKDEKKELFQNFIKPNYYTPEVMKYHKKEINQKDTIVKS